MAKVRSIGVFCASSSQVDKSYFEQAFRLGQILADHGIEVVYGDGGLGLMGELARGVNSRNGLITGVIPQFMVDEGWNNPKSSRTHIVQTMHERKALIESLSDAMVALPGGIGTYEELLECMTWKQLGLHTKPIVILNHKDYYTPLLKCFDKMVSERFLNAVYKQLYTVVSDAEDVLPAIEKTQAWTIMTRKDAAF